MIEGYKLFRILPWIVLLLIVSVVLFSYRDIFSYQYDEKLMHKNYYDSQYVWPSGSQILDDNSLYKVVGYKIVEGDNPFFINYEVPPFAKSLYGISTHLFLNPYYASILFYLLSIWAVFYLTNLTFQKRKISWISALVFAANPLTAYQVGQTMLDLPLTLLMLIHVIFLFQLVKTKKIWMFSILSGGFLGLMAATKIGYYIPVILLLSILFLLMHKIRFGALLVFLSTIGGYVTGWWVYFIYHPNPIPWLRLHDKIISYYSGSRPTPYYLNELQTILFNKYQGWWREDTIPMVEWSLLLPLGLSVFIYYLIVFKSLLKKNILLTYLVLLCLVLLVMNSLVPFWPRYLMVVVPLFSIFAADLLSKRDSWLIVFIILYLPFLIPILRLKV